jgi:hypothetical protein
MPLGCGQQPTQMPLGHRARSQPRQPCDGRLFLVGGLADQQPGEDHMMPMMKHRSEHVQPIRHWLGQPCEIKHGGSSPRAIRVDHRTRGGTQRKVFGQTVLANDLLGTGAKPRFQVHGGREPVAFKLIRQAWHACPSHRRGPRAWSRHLTPPMLRVSSISCISHRGPMASLRASGRSPWLPRCAMRKV